MVRCKATRHLHQCTVSLSFITQNFNDTKSTLFMMGENTTVVIKLYLQYPYIHCCSKCLLMYCACHTLQLSSMGSTSLILGVNSIKTTTSSSDDFQQGKLAYQTGIEVPTIILMSNKA